MQRLWYLLFHFNKVVDNVILKSIKVVIPRSPVYGGREEALQFSSFVQIVAGYQISRD